MHFKLCIHKSKIKRIMLPISLLLVLLYGCNDPVISEVPPSHGMGVRYTERGLEKFCQKGYAIVPDIISQMQPFVIEEISLVGLRISLVNIRVRTVRLATMNMFLHRDGRIKMEARDGLMQLSMRVIATIKSITGQIDVMFSLKDFGADLSALIGEDPDCAFHFGLFNFSNKVYMSKLDMDAVGLDTIGNIIANMLQTMIPMLESLLRETILQKMLDVILQSVRNIMLGMPTMSRKGEYRTDQRYLRGINILDKKIVADLDGYSYICHPGTDTPASTRYPVNISSPPPKTVYSDKDYEIYFDREAINSYLHAWQSHYNTYSLTNINVRYRDIQATKISGLVDALVEAGVLNSENDTGDGVELSLSVQLTKPPYVPWIGAAGLPVYLDGTFDVTARKGNENKHIIRLDSTALMLGIFNLSSFNAGFNSDRAYGYIVLTDLVDLTVAKIENSYAKLDSIALIKYMISTLYIPKVNKVFEEPGIILINGNFVNYKTATAVYLLAEDRILFIADIVSNPYFS